MRCLLLPLIAAAAFGQEIHTTLEHVPVDGGGVVWEVTLRAEDVGEPAPTLHLEDWGEWTEHEGYLELVESEPPLVGEGPAWSVDPEADWDERLLVRLRLHPTRLGSPGQRAHGLLPTTGPTYTFGFSSNVVPNLVRDGTPIEAERTLALRAPDGVMITSGWDGHGRGHQHFDLDAAQGNAMVAFGDWTSMEDSDRVEVYQFGGTHPIADELHHLIERLLPTMAEGCAHPAARPQRVFVVDTRGGGTGTDFGLRIGFTAGMDEGSFESPYFQQLVAHELFHHWLGGELHPADDSLVWFQEGFTDYLALWHATRAGVHPRAWFLERITELDQEARDRSSLGSVPFVGGDVRWRDGDGPNEVMAYKGGATLALAIDAELRARGEGSLHDLLRDLLAAGDRYDTDQLRSWWRARGLEDLDAAAVAGLDLPRAADSLLRAGLRQGRTPAHLTYLGLRTSGEPFGRVEAVDPAGPAARAGVRVGDLITGLSPARRERPRLADGVVVAMPYGLTLLDPEGRDHRIQVGRGEEQLDLAITPEVRDGGLLDRWILSGPAADAFFDLPE